MALTQTTIWHILTPLKQKIMLINELFIYVDHIAMILSSSQLLQI